MTYEERIFLGKGFDPIKYFKEVYNNKDFKKSDKLIWVMHPHMLKLYKKQLNKEGYYNILNIDSFRGIEIITSYNFGYTQIELLKW